MPKPQYVKAAALLTFVALTAALFGYGIWRSVTDPAGGAESAKTSPASAPASSLAQAPSQAQAQARAQASAPAAAASEGREAAWARFRERYGSGLQARFGGGGAVAAIQGAPGSGARAGGSFRSDDPQKAIARAREILDAARDLIGEQGDAPLDSPIAKAGIASAQVYFHERKGGVPVEPGGSVKVDLGPQGELLGLSSDYVPNIQVANEPRIDAEQAKTKAASAISDPAGGPAPEGGNHVLWVQARQGDAAIARHAYVYVVQGRKVVVDASNGDILARRDRRDF